MEAADDTVLDKLAGVPGGGSRAAPPRSVESRSPPARAAATGAARANLIRRLKGQLFRTIVHSADVMVSGLAAEGLPVRYRHRTRAWRIIVLERAIA